MFSSKVAIPTADAGKYGKHGKRKSGPVYEFYHKFTKWERLKAPQDYSASRWTSNF